MTLKESLKENRVNIKASEEQGLGTGNWEETEKLLLIQMNLNKQIIDLTKNHLYITYDSPFFIP